MERRRPSSDRARSCQDLPLERPVTLPLGHDGSPIWLVGTEGVNTLCRENVFLSTRSKPFKIHNTANQIPVFCRATETICTLLVPGRRSTYQHYTRTPHDKKVSARGRSFTAFNFHCDFAAMYIVIILTSCDWHTQGSPQDFMKA